MTTCFTERNRYFHGFTASVTACFWNSWFSRVF